MRRVKIVATLGPALDDEERLKEAIAAGIDVLRLNFSHGDKSDHKRRLDLARTFAEEMGREISSFGDLQGPKIRLGMLPATGIELEDGAEVVLVSGVEHLTQEPEQTPVTLPVAYELLAHDVSPGSMILIDDGLIRLVVNEIDGPHVHTRVISGGHVSSRKGVNLPGINVSVTSLTEKDRNDLQAMIDIGVDWIALSFVRTPDDILTVRELIRQFGGHQPIIAKLERPEAVENLEEILKVTDAVMVARGDLGVEIGPEQVPALQKEIIDLANRYSRPVITATEMLESMVRSPRPTRAEASDVANAVFDGTDAVMLSAETASGRFPVQAVRTMAEIITVAESAPHRISPRVPDPTATESVVAKASIQVANDVDAKAILVFSFSGRSIQLVSKFRPKQPLIGFTSEDATLGRLPLMWGVTGRRAIAADQSLALIMAADEVCMREGYGERGDPVVIVSGIPGGHGGTNRVMVHRLGEIPV